MAARQTPLFHRSAGQGGKADHVAGGIDVRDLTLEECVHHDFATRVGSMPAASSPNLVAIRLAAYRIKKHVGMDVFSAFKLGENAIVSGSMPTRVTFSPSRKVVPIWRK